METKSHVIVSLTTIPSRIAKILPVLKNLLNQTFCFDKCVLYIPDVCTRLPDHKYEISEELKNFLQDSNGRFEIHHVPMDWGPGTKIIPALLEWQDKSQVIWSIDDDILLEKHALEELMAAHLKLPNAILGFMGTLQDRFIHSEHLDPTELYEVEGLGGYRSILYPTLLCKQFPYLFRELQEAHLKQFQLPVLDDDHALKLCAINQHIKRVIVGTHFPSPTRSHPIVPALNITFLETDDGVSHPNTSERFMKSHEFITHWFQTKTQ